MPLFRTIKNPPEEAPDGQVRGRSPPLDPADWRRVTCLVCRGTPGARNAARADGWMRRVLPVYPFEGDNVITPFLNDARAASFTVSGELRFPGVASVPVPAVIVAHTSAGPVSDVPTVTAAMRAAGFATLVYRSLPLATSRIAATRQAREVGRVWRFIRRLMPTWPSKHSPEIPA